jgi:hypothetical protein
MCKDGCIVGIVWLFKKEFIMTQYVNAQIVSAFAAVICAFITIGISVAPAVAPVSGLVA